MAWVLNPPLSRFLSLEKEVSYSILNKVNSCIFRKRDISLGPFLYYPLSLMPYLVITLIVSFTMHELAHAYVAYKFGDDTAKREGRLTLNPIKHLDPFGTILILVAGFGWARPIPVNRRFFKKPRLAGVLVSIAGPVSNLILAFVGFFLLVLMHAYGMEMLAAFSTGLDQFFPFGYS